VTISLRMFSLGGRAIFNEMVSSHIRERWFVHHQNSVRLYLCHGFTAFAKVCVLQHKPRTAVVLIHKALFTRYW